MKPFEQMRERLEAAREDSDVTYFHTLLLLGELALKLAVAGLAAALVDDVDRHRYRQLHRLVRADGLGEWVGSLEDMLKGPAAQVLPAAAYREQGELTQMSSAGTWQHESVSLIDRVLQRLNATNEPLPAKLAGLRWFQTFVSRVLKSSSAAYGIDR